MHIVAVRRTVDRSSLNGQGSCSDAVLSAGIDHAAFKASDLAVLVEPELPGFEAEFFTIRDIDDCVSRCGGRLQRPVSLDRAVSEHIDRGNAVLRIGVYALDEAFASAQSQRAAFLHGQNRLLLTGHPEILRGKLRSFFHDDPEVLAHAAVADQCDGAAFCDRNGACRFAADVVFAVGYRNVRNGNIPLDIKHRAAWIVNGIDDRISVAVKGDAVRPFPRVAFLLKDQRRIRFDGRIVCALTVGLLSNDLPVGFEHCFERNAFVFYNVYRDILCDVAPCPSLSACGKAVAAPCTRIEIRNRSSLIDPERFPVQVASAERHRTHLFDAAAVGHSFELRVTIRNGLVLRVAERGNKSFRLHICSVPDRDADIIRFHIIRFAPGLAAGQHIIVLRGGSALAVEVTDRAAKILTAGAPGHRAAAVGVRQRDRTASADQPARVHGLNRVLRSSGVDLAAVIAGRNRERFVHTLRNDVSDNAARSGVGRQDITVVGAKTDIAVRPSGDPADAVLSGPNLIIGVAIFRCCNVTVICASADCHLTAVAVTCDPSDARVPGNISPVDTVGDRSAFGLRDDASGPVTGRTRLIISVGPALLIGDVNVVDAIADFAAFAIAYDSASAVMDLRLASDPDPADRRAIAVAEQTAVAAGLVDHAHIEDRASAAFQRSGETGRRSIHADSRPKQRAASAVRVLQGDHGAFGYVDRLSLEGDLFHVDKIGQSRQVLR